MGIRASPTCNLILDNVRVPRENIVGMSIIYFSLALCNRLFLGEIGGGFKLAMIQLDNARVGIASQALGIAQAALEIALEYASLRKAFGQPINQLQAVKVRILHLKTKCDPVGSLYRSCCVCYLNFKH